MTSSLLSPFVYKFNWIRRDTYDGCKARFNSNFLWFIWCVLCIHPFWTVSHWFVRFIHLFLCHFLQLFASVALLRWTLFSLLLVNKLTKDIERIEIYKSPSSFEVPRKKLDRCRLPFEWVVKWKSSKMPAVNENFVFSANATIEIFFGKMSISFVICIIEWEIQLCPF